MHLVITAPLGPYHVLPVQLVTTAQHHQGMQHYVQLEIIPIMEKEYVAHVPVAKCAQILHNSLRYACLRVTKAQNVMQIFDCLKICQCSAVNH